MRNFNYYHPTRILFGRERINEIGKIIAPAQGIQPADKSPFFFFPPAKPGGL